MFDGTFKAELARLESSLDALVGTNPREAAEHALAAGLLCLQNGRTRKAKEFAEQTLQLLNCCPLETMEECAMHNVSICEVTLPSFIHQDLVRSRFGLSNPALHSSM
jgi:hypothetical protein